MNIPTHMAAIIPPAQIARNKVHIQIQNLVLYLQRQNVSTFRVSPLIWEFEYIKLCIIILGKFRHNKESV